VPAPLTVTSHGERCPAQAGGNDKPLRNGCLSWLSNPHMIRVREANAPNRLSVSVAVGESESSTAEFSATTTENFVSNYSLEAFPLLLWSPLFRSLGAEKLGK